MSFVEILIADDHNLVRRGLRSLIETHASWRVCGDAANAGEAVSRGSGVGIREMQERLRKFQGTMTIESTSGGTATIAAIRAAEESGDLRGSHENSESAV